MSLQQAKKVTKDNFLPSSIERRYPIYSGQFNDLVDILNTLITGSNALAADTIGPITAGGAVTINGVQLKNGGTILTKGTITQGSSIVTGVTVNTSAGVITTVALTTAASTVAGPFTVTNSAVLSTSTITVQVEYATGKTGFPVALIEAVTTGSFKIRLLNVDPVAALNDVVKIHFIVS